MSRIIHVSLNLMTYGTMHDNTYTQTHECQDRVNIMYAEFQSKRCCNDILSKPYIPHSNVRHNELHQILVNYVIHN